MGRSMKPCVSNWLKKGRTFGVQIGYLGYLEME
jgi:hypothetical protein